MIRPTCFFQASARECPLVRVVTVLRVTESAYMLLYTSQFMGICADNSFGLGWTEVGAGTKHRVIRSD